METLLLPVAFSQEMPEGFPLQDAPQGFGNFTEVLAKQYFKEGNPPPEDLQMAPGDPASSVVTKSFPAAFVIPDGIAFPQEKPILDQCLTAPAAKEGFPAPSPAELSSLFIFLQPSPGPETGAGVAGMNGGKPEPLPGETLSPAVPHDREKGALTPPVFFPSGSGETNQEINPGGEKISGKPGQNIFPILPSNSSAGQEGGMTFQEPPIPPDSSTSLKDPLRSELAGNMEMVLEREKKTAHPADSSTPPNSLEEKFLGGSTGKKEMPSERETKNVFSFDWPTSPVSWKDSLRKEPAGKMESPVGEGKKFIRPSILQESNGAEKRPIQDSNDFLAGSQPSLEMEANPRTGEVRGLKRQGPLFWAAKDAAGPEIPQNLQERDSLVGNQPYIPGSIDREAGTHFGANAGKGQGKVLWPGADLLPLPNRETQNHPSFFRALIDPLNRQVENGGWNKEASSAVSPRPEPPGVFQQVGQNVLWLIRNNEEKIRIALEPPELGQVFLEIDRHKDHVKAVLWTDNLATKASLETSQAEIQKIIEGEGFKLEKFNVFVQQDPGWFQGRKENPGRQDSWGASLAAEERAPSANSVESVPGRTSSTYLASGYLDLLV